MKIVTQMHLKDVFVFTCLLFCLGAMPAEEIPELPAENIAPASIFRQPVDDSDIDGNLDYRLLRLAPSFEDKSSPKKRLSAFVPVRGKKVILESERPSENFLNSEKSGDDRETLARFANFRLRNFYDNQPMENSFQNSLSPIPTNKRKSSFMPMRGRKSYFIGGPLGSYLQSMKSEFSDSDYQNTPLDNDNSYSNFPFGKDETNFMDQDEIEKHFKLIKSQPFTMEAVNKRAVGFVPTRGRRGKHDWSEDYQTGKLTYNHSKNINEILGEDHQRYRRASAFMPMRGRKSSNDYPYWPQLTNQILESDNAGRAQNIETLLRYLPEVVKIRESGVIGQQKGSKRFDDEALGSSLLQQNLRTAVVMKRPVSFFAARGKRLNVA